jgi:hypothetical protein
MTPAILTLPTECVETIASFLSLKDILNFQLASAELAIKSCDAFKAQFEKVINIKTRRRIGSRKGDERKFLEICEHSRLASCLRFLCLGLEAIHFDISATFLGQALSQLLNLKELELYIPPRPLSTMMFQDLCFSTQIPRLERFKLTGHGIANHKDLVMLLNNHLSTLRTVEFNGVRLPENSWPAVLDTFASLKKLNLVIQECTRGSLLEHIPAFVPSEHDTNVDHFPYIRYKWGADHGRFDGVDPTFEHSLAYVKRCYVGNQK